MLKFLLRYQLAIFVLLLAIPAVVFAWRVGHLLPLYTDSSLRASVRSTLTTVTDREGWLLSDLSLTEVTHDHVTLMHRMHRRGSDPQTCVRVTLADSSLHPCN